MPKCIKDILMISQYLRYLWWFLIFLLCRWILIFIRYTINILAFCRRNGYLLFFFLYIVPIYRKEKNKYPSILQNVNIWNVHIILCIWRLSRDFCSAKSLLLTITWLREYNNSKVSLVRCQSILTLLIKCQSILTFLIYNQS